MKNHLVRKRANKACLNCRGRKIKCQFESPAHETCIKCTAEKEHCVFVQSRRGLNRRHSRSTSSFSSVKDSPSPGQSPELQLLAEAATNTTAALAKKKTSTPAVITGSTKQPDKNGHSRAPSSAASTLPLSPMRSPKSIKELAPQQNFYAASPAMYRHMSDSSNGRNPVVSEPQISDKISDFCLVKKGVMNSTQLKLYVLTFFVRHHHYLPLMPSHQTPTTDNEIVRLLVDEPILVVAFVVIVSRFENSTIHAKAWQYMKEIISGLTIGTIVPTLGAIEALLLLSENVPCFSDKAEEADLHNTESLMTWNLIGLAISLGYYLGLDQKTMMLTSENMDAESHRMRLVWTYSFMYDRQASIRLGRPFRSRGPSPCITDYRVRTSIAAGNFQTFSTLIPSPTSTEEYSLSAEALFEITSLLSNIHETFYPNRDRTIALVQVEHYERLLDDFTRAFSGFKEAWKDKEWQQFPIKEAVWTTYLYANLYAYVFAFQAHLQRAAKFEDKTLQETVLQSPGWPQRVFPRGIGGSLDAKFIQEAKRAACEILEVYVPKFHQGGALPYLPTRFYSFFTYASIFLIKLIFTGAITDSENSYVIKILQVTIHTFDSEAAAYDNRHPLAVASNQLRVLLKTLWPASSSNNSESISFSNIGSPQTVDGTNGGRINNGFDPTNIDFNWSMYVNDNATRELTTFLSAELDSDIWLQYFSQFDASFGESQV